MLAVGMSWCCVRPASPAKVSRIFVTCSCPTRRKGGAGCRNSHWIPGSLTPGFLCSLQLHLCNTGQVFALKCVYCSVASVFLLLLLLFLGFLVLFLEPIGDDSLCLYASSDWTSGLIEHWVDQPVCWSVPQPYLRTDPI